MIASEHLEEFEPRADPYIGTTLAGRYRVLRRLGGGGMGSVYEAEHVVIGRRVAVKMLHAQLSVHDEVVRRFLNEARAAAMIRHPNILECTDIGQTDDGAPFLVLELLEGRDLDSCIREQGALPAGRVVRIALQVASALQRAHGEGVVHRDIKPENVFLLEGDDVRVLDFGIAKLTGRDANGVGTTPGAVLGTPSYMAPEQFGDASRVGPSADIYALGVLLYEALSGELPFRGQTLPELVVQVMTEPPPPLETLRPDLPKALVATVMRAMAKSPDARQASMAELARELEPFASHDAPVPLGVRASRDVPSRSGISLRSGSSVEEALAAAGVRPSRDGRARSPMIVLVGVVALASLVVVAVVVSRRDQLPAADVSAASPEHEELLEQTRSIDDSAAARPSTEEDEVEGQSVLEGSSGAVERTDETPDGVEMPGVALIETMAVETPPRGRPTTMTKAPRGAEDSANATPATPMTPPPATPAPGRIAPVSLGEY
ncbi:MAG: serine/threonine protein kinase [Myxococcales bacterium]|nr:serine/threonine protein kinase [Myxococcales bacterium]